MNELRVTAVCVGQPTALKVGGRTTVTGIDKHPLPGHVQVTRAGLDGDHVLNRKHHGGPDQAVYAYTMPDYAAWAAELAAPARPGLFGENLTISGLSSAEVRVGDRLTVHGAAGEVVLEVTAPRIPCGTLAAHVREGSFVKRFARMRRPGLYLRVLQEGTVGAGDPVSFTPGDPAAPTLGELFDAYVGEPDLTRDSLQAWLAFPLAQRTRRDLEGRLSKLG
ncbi:MOSC domain-containing protein [Deinococcus arcticus]|uniref:MOSC domain-containing protein n=1 Tax=Deinococcus arcticus TaxID=2136176 RepID=A0A2T3WCN5_9DEIO|nr:MOSC domain-containing protein [Deinococcus arcticus]PTA69602.1 MOSC domain-containing protein [Deinococcus arcticus]